MEYTIYQLAKSAGISIRTLDYYDEIGLLKPSKIRSNGYRLYGEKELLKLQQILFFKELEFPLDEIKKMLHAKSFNQLEALSDQKKLLQLKKERIDGLVQTIDKTMNSLKGGEKMSNDDLYGSFSKKQMEEYQEEAKKRWGDTEAWKQSQERTKNWTQEDYKRVAKEGAEFTQKIADAMDKGIQNPEVQELIAQHYKGVQFFYDCPLDVYKSLGEMYVSDPRFTAFYDKFRPGLAVFMKDAIAYYCEQKSK